MYYSPFLTLALFSYTSAFVLPAQQSDGLYQIRLPPSGQETHSSLSMPPFHYTTTTTTIKTTTSFSVINPLAKSAALGQTHCDCSTKLSPTDTDAAVADLQAKLVGKAQWLDPSASYYSVRGDVVAFVCNDDANNRLKVWKDVVNQAVERLSGACGKYVAGSTGAKFDYSIGYMKNTKGMDFCGKALASPKKSC